MVRVLILLLIAFAHIVGAASNPHAGAPPLHLDSIAILGNDVTNRAVIMRELPIKVGDWIDSSDIEEIRLRLTNLNLFHRVEVFPIQRDTSVILTIAVTEKWYFFPLPYASWIGPNPDDYEYGFRFVHNNLNGLNRSGVISIWGGKKQGELILYYDPWMLNTKGLGLLMTVQHERWRDKEITTGKLWQRERITGIGGIMKHFTNEHTLRIFGGMHRMIMQPQFSVGGTGKDEMMVLRVEYQLDHRDLYELPHRGDYLLCWVDMTRMTNVWKNRTVTGFDARRYIPLAADWTLTSQANFLTADGIDPDYMKLRLGETLPLHGYKNLSKPGDVLVKGTLDLRYTLLRTRYWSWNQAPVWLVKHTRNLKYGFSVSLFSEVGQAWRKEDPVEAAKPLVSYGTAFSVTLPYINIMRLNLGFNPTDGMGAPSLLVELRPQL